MSESEVVLKALASHGDFAGGKLSPLNSTGNNRLFKLTANGGDYVVKCYSSHPQDPRNRYETEHLFYRYLESSRIPQTARAKLWLPDKKMAVFHFIQGQKPLSISPGLLEQAVNFFCLLNKDRSALSASKLPDASESCFSLHQHLDVISKRLARLEQIGQDNTLDCEARKFVEQKLSPQWENLKQRRLANAGSLAGEASLPGSQRCITPSDFGFHNALEDSSGNLHFFDFEYAGWDDPAKTLCDFFCQPEIPAGAGHLPYFCSRAASELDFPDLHRRVKWLFPLYQIKWCCIILNEFLPAGSFRRKFSNPTENTDERKQKQLAKAIQSIQQLNHDD